MQIGAPPKSPPRPHSGPSAPARKPKPRPDGDTLPSGDTLQLSSRARKETQPALTPEAPPKPPTPPRALADVQQGAQKVFLLGDYESKDTWRTVEQRSLSLVLKHDPEVTYLNEWDATDQMKLNEGNDREALAALPDDARARYEEIRKLLAPMASTAQYGLHLLLVEGRLDPSTPDGKALLDALYDMTTRPLDPQVDRAQLVGALVQEVARPVTIQQMDTATCTVTSIQLMLAREHPADYVRIVGELASPEGKAQLVGGELMRADNTLTAPTVTRNGKTELDPRSPSSRLIQSAFMELGNGPDLRYDELTDKHMKGDKAEDSGLNDFQIEVVLKAVTGTAYRSRTIHGESADELLTRIKERTNKGALVPATFRWQSSEGLPGSGGLHMVLITGVDDAAVQLANPWGEVDRVPMEDARKLIEGAQFPKP